MSEGDIIVTEDPAAGESVDERSEWDGSQGEVGDQVTTDDATVARLQSFGRWVRVSDDPQTFD